MSTLPRRGLNARQTETVGRLLEAAEQELATVGPEGLTIRTVAGRAGVSPATAYTYFCSKNHLFAELFHRKVLLEHPAEITGRTPLQRVTAGDDIGKVIAALLSDDCGWITGENIDVSGGFNL